MDRFDNGASGPTPVDVTIVVATFNRPRFLVEAVESLLAQTRPARRLVVVDDGSTDDTRGALERAGLAGRIDFIRQDNGGKARALNRALATVTTRFVWFFDDDDAAYPDALARLSAAFDADPGIAIAFGAFDIGRGDARLLDMATTPAPYGFAHETLPEQRLRLFRNYSFSMSGSLLLTSAVRDAGGLDASLIRSQDYDLLIRIAARQAFRYCGASVFIVREHDGPRGGPRARHAAADKVRVWTRFNVRIGNYLRYELPLCAYSPRPDERPAPDGIRDALITRAWALAPKLALADAVQDVLEAFAQPCATPLQPPQIDRLGEVFNDDSVPPRPLAGLLRLWRLVLRPDGAVALTALAKGLYWAAAARPGQGRARAVAMALAAVARLGLFWRPSSAARALPDAGHGPV